MRMTRRATLALMLAGSLAGCDAMTKSFGGVVGSGVLKEETRTVTDFKAIEVNNAFTVNVTIGEKTSLKISADDNLMPLIATEVADGVLKIRYTENKVVSPKTPSVVTIVMPSLNRVRLAGASTLDATVAKTDDFEAKAEGASTLVISGIDCQSVNGLAKGASKITLKGQARSGDLSAQGASTLSTSDLTLETAKVKLDGASTGTVKATQAIEGSASGACTLSVQGNPKDRRVTSSGASTVNY